MILTIHAKPCAKEESIEQMNETEFRIAVKEPPEKGKANKRIVQLLAKKFRVLSKNVTIKNPTSRIKRAVIKKN